MNAKNVLKIASLFVNLADEFSPIIDETEDTVDTQTQKEFEIFLKCLNLVYTEISTDYLPILEKQRVLVENGKVYLDDISESIKDIVSVKLASNEKNVKYTLFSNYIEVGAGGYVDIVYSIYPTALTLTSDIDSFGGKVSEKCLALGTASEYCYINGFYDEAEIWDNRFKDSLQIACRKKSEIILPKRRWL